MTFLIGVTSILIDTASTSPSTEWERKRSVHGTARLEGAHVLEEPARTDKGFAATSTRVPRHVQVKSATPIRTESAAT